MSLQAGDQSKREPLKEVSNSSLELSTSSNVVSYLPSIYTTLSTTEPNSKYLTSASLTKFQIFHVSYQERSQIFSLVGEALVKYFEFGSVVLNVVYMEGR